MMWVDFKMSSSSNGDMNASMHFISEATAVFDEDKKMVELKYKEPSESEDIQVQMVVLDNQVFVFRTGEYSMEQSFDLNMMTTGELALPEGRLDLMTTTTRLEQEIDYTNQNGNLDIAYTMFVQNEYSGDFHFQLKFYNDEKESIK
ncbi:MAG: DUF1934 family protein [Culicoidibacterales bacterium]